MTDPLVRPEGLASPWRSIRLAHVSDLHIGAEDGPDAAASLIADLHAAQVQATIVTGDLTMRARSHEFARAKEVIDAFPNPTVAIIGNHDVPLRNPFRRLTIPYRGFQAMINEDLDPLLDVPGVRVRGLGSMPPWRWKSGRVSHRQADLVRSTFAGVPADVVRVLALHHPPSSSDLSRIAGRGRLEQAMVDAEVDLVLAGHTHVPMVQQLQLASGTRTRTIIEVVAGTAISHRTRGVARSWSLLELTPATISVTAHRADQDAWRIGPVRSWPLDTRSRRAAG